MRHVKLSEVDRLLQRYGLDARTGDMPLGGKVGTISVSLDSCDPVMVVSVEGARAASRCPVDALHAALMIEALRNQHALYDEDGFERMLGELFIAVSRMFLESGASRLAFESMRLHPASYHAGRVTMRYRTPAEDVSC